MKLDDVIQQPGRLERNQLDATLAKTCVSLPCKIVKYDSTQRTVDVQPLVREVGVQEDPPLLMGVPVWFPGSFTYDISVGDECLVVFADRSIDAWWQSGKVSNPVSARRHNLSDGIAFVGIKSLTNVTEGINLNEKLVEMTGATSNEDGASGFVPAPHAGDNNKYLKGDGTWGTVESGGGDVVGPSSAVSGRVATFDGTTGKLIKDSGYTIEKSVPSDAVFTDTTYSAGSGLALSGTTFRVDVPRVAESANHLPELNSFQLREYTSGTNYNLPSNAWYHIYEAKGLDPAYGTQLALGMTTDAVYYRKYAGGSWGSWKSLINTDHYDWSDITNKPSFSYLPLSGGTLTGAVTFANNTWNSVGDDVKIGDHNVAGGLGIIGVNGNTRLDFCKKDAAGTYKSITFDGTTLSLDGNCTGSSGSCTGNATTCTYPNGFSSRNTNATWGDQTGATVTAWNEADGGSIDFRKNNPSSGKLSIKVDGRFYGNEGTNPAMLMNYANGYWGIGTPDGNASDWIRVTSSGIIPYQGGSVGSGHGYIGTSTWFFGTGYIDTVHSHQLIVEGATNATMTASSTNPRITFQENTGTQPVHLIYSDWDSYRAPAGLKVIGGTSATPAWFEVEGEIYASKVHNAVWNDYAECRKVEILEPGRCVTETESGTMALTTERLQPGCKITSDTYGVCMGETAEAKTPIAVAGRVLVYPFRDRKEYHLGDAVCSAPNGTVDVMTRDEIKEYPERIVGTVSEIPKCDVWHGGAQDGNNDIQVNGRIWVYVR